MIDRTMWTVTSPDHGWSCEFTSVDVDGRASCSAEEAALHAARRAWDDWAWEDASLAWPLRLVVQGAERQEFLVDFEAEPNFFVRREV